MTTFDFGSGPVPAHRHKNPDGSEGGWVADSASVDTTAYIGPDARVFGNARVSGTAWVSGNAWVYDNTRVSGTARVFGTARVYGDAWVFGTAWAESPPQMQIGRWTGCLSAIGVVQIGCQVHTLAEWDAIDEDELIKEYGATLLEVALSRAFLAICRDVSAAMEIDTNTRGSHTEAS